MILCCDTINIVKKASRDLKVQRSLSRKRVATSRSSSRGVSLSKATWEGLTTVFNMRGTQLLKKQRYFRIRAIHMNNNLNCPIQGRKPMLISQAQGQRIKVLRCNL